ncbi:hypothetical protein RJ640_023163 [Escallonia rubra]|uniref:WRKY19-like zinc finger domain-containing protein n=1 Tax=Escallonia rubra TaxID=112253 RepID=A0AA88R6I7_9ASTE|nr:hypothetical protein RJ640_023163 [Escallonia rubra]
MYMDKTPEKCTADAARLCRKVDETGGHYSAVNALRPDFLHSKGKKRNRSVGHGSLDLQAGSSLVLGLGRPSSSCITISSEKEIEEESSINLCLGVNPHLGNHQTLDLIPGKPKLDLELSLSTGPAESDITTSAQGHIAFESSTGIPLTTSTINLVDEGSTSSRWKLGSRLLPLQSTDINVPLEHIPSIVNQIPVFPSLTSTSTATPKSSVGYASGVVHQHHGRNASVRTCQFDGCTRGARGASGFCIAHGGGRRCKRAGCQKGAEGKTVFCKAHGGGRRCQHLGCTKSAEGRTDYCIGHGGGRRCSHDGCARAARGKSGLCIRHGGGKRCRVNNCSKSAEGISGLCISHGGGHRCQYPDCTKGAQGSTIFCKAHGGGKRCTYLGCTKGAEGSTPFCKGHGGGKRCTYEGGCTKSVHGGTLFCVSHGGGKRCAMAECTKSARGRTNFCVRHGGGKRCKSEGCKKSAQGSTDFCKAHGGGKRCSWTADPCDKFARGKSGLCASHGSQVQDGPLDRPLQGPQSCTAQKMKDIFVSENNRAAGKGTSTGFIHYGCQSVPRQIPAQESFPAEHACSGHFSLPEGRVHGGSLMAMLRGSVNFGPSNDSQLLGGTSDPRKSDPAPRSWV